jgi:anti-sigma B factor antagonist
MLKVEIIKDVTVVKFNNTDRINALITEAVKDQLKLFFNKSETKLVLNLEGIKFIDSSGFGVFLSIMKTATNNHGHFKICNVSNEVMELFKLLQLHNVFEIYSSVDESVASFN